MRSMIRNFVLAPAIIAAAAFTATTAMASTTVKVPFSFTAAGKTCPAGIYSVQQDLSHSLVTLKSYDASHSFSWTLNPGDPNPTDTGVTLKFDEFGESHVLQSVRFGSLITPRLDKKVNPDERAATRIVQGQ
jgi:hypothetical protein